MLISQIYKWIAKIFQNILPDFYQLLHNFAQSYKVYLHLLRL